jgi:hypothetical protein
MASFRVANRVGDSPSLTTTWLRERQWITSDAVLTAVLK